MAAIEDSKDTSRGRLRNTSGYSDFDQGEKWERRLDSIRTDSFEENLREANANEFPPDPNKPTVQQSWDAIMKMSDMLDDDNMNGYKEDLDTLLVFAGLFSSVVTAFVVESYGWLQADPADTTVALLSQIAHQMSSGGQSQSLPPPPPLPFTPSPSVVRINTFWFLSLTLALVDALFGLLCKQWVREQQRKIIARTPGQALTLRWLRLQSFERWHVPKILACLPILLEIALFLFFAGLLELLYIRNQILFAFTFTVIGIAVVFYLTTTLLPGIDILRQVFETHPYFATENPVFEPDDILRLPKIEFICPYRSPQSGFLFHLFAAVYRIPGCKRLLYSFITTFNREWKKSTASVGNLDYLLTKNIAGISNWSSVDMNTVERFSSIPKCPDLYQLKGFRWLAQGARDISAMKPHVKNVLGEVHPHLVMPAVFDRWESPYGKPMWSATDVEGVLELGHRRGDNGMFNDQATGKDLGLASRILCFRYLLATYDDYRVVDSGSDDLARVAGELWDQIRKHPRGDSRVITTLVCPGEFLMAPARDWRGKGLEFYKKQWDKMDLKSQVKLVENTSKSMNSFLKSSKRSEDEVGGTLLASTYGLDFFIFLNDKVCKTGTLQQRPWTIEHWMEMLSHVRRVHQLPIQYFKSIPGTFPIPSNELKRTLDCSGTSESTLVALLDTYEECWNGAHRFVKQRVVCAVSDHIHRVLPSGLDPLSPLSEEPDQLSSSPSSTFITSARGLSFLTFVNERFHKDFGLLDWCGQNTICRWVDALDRVRIHRRLPLGYFSPLPMRYRVTGEVTGWYKAKDLKEGGGIFDIGGLGVPSAKCDEEDQTEEIQKGSNEGGSSSTSSGGEKLGSAEVFKLTTDIDNHQRTQVTVLEFDSGDTEKSETQDRQKLLAGGPGTESNV
ncbi:hypothetical protein E1B28_008048 [Marasmius oreades]|uniref:DUF6535 domain-containing protein n=1 Tax=Marasmius oreades TaxID=181124 RepID=A0A9P7S348_9AGAR|nr:uncharacterized protein E1B28_008048 [Marasmius oreades]KAG7094452.1 hypothetical protein E1B28_008048 [Marasmius oreades]